MTTLGSSGGAADIAAHMVMPVIVLSVSMAGTNIRYIRSAVLEILQQDYLRTARAKGLGRRPGGEPARPAQRHGAHRNGDRHGDSRAVRRRCDRGTAVFLARPGANDHERHHEPGLPGDHGVCLLSAVVVLAGNLITDILYAVVNPTIQYQ